MLNDLQTPKGKRVSGGRKDRGDACISIRQNKKPSSGLYKQANLMMQNPADRRRHPTNIAIVVMDHGHMGILDAVFELGDLHPFGTGGL